MTLPPLTIIPAGAGSGKTYRIETQLADWLEAGLVAPERIVGVTFTEAAASDLRRRIRQRLVRRGMWEDALRLDRAYISTIHGFGLRLLSELPFEVGISPRLRKLSEDEERALVASALSRSDLVEHVMLRLSDYGYKTTRVGDDWRSGEDEFRGHLLELIALYRRIGRESPDPRLITSAGERITAVYGPVVDGDRLTADLRASCEALLASFPESLTRTLPDLNKTAREALHRDHPNLVRAVSGPDLASDWNLWKDLAALRQSMRGTPLPEPYDDLAQAVKDAAGRLSEHPGPRDAAIGHATAMLEAAAEGVEHYGSEKRERSLVDFSDMVAQAYAMLTRSPEALAEMRRRVDCLVIDEFQDTNPIQFSLLWALHRAEVPALIVGDVKQSIMGFQGADARLFQMLERSGLGLVEPLTSNWRTSRPLMMFLNAASEGLFGDEYDALEPEVDRESFVWPLEVVAATSSKSGQSKVDLRRGVACRIAEMLCEERPEVYDANAGRHRSIRGEDVAVLCRTKAEVKRYAAALRGAGVRPLIDQDGWHASRVVQLACHALAYVADPADTHAALYLAVSELGSLEPETALKRLLDADVSDGPASSRLAEPLLARLDAVRAGRPDRTVAALVDETVAALGMWDRISSWPDADQARANLLRLGAEAGRFVDSDREALAAGGFVGADLKTFLAWLPTRSAEDDMQPQPRVRDEDAVVVTTWHSAKGREWPVVVVATTWWKIQTRLPETSVVYESFDDLDNALDKARIAVSPSFACKDTNERFKDELAADEMDSARRELYVALTRPREKLILEWPTYWDSKDDETYHWLLRAEVGLQLSDGLLRLGDDSFECVVTEVEDVPDGASAIAVSRRGLGGTVQELPASVGRRALLPAEPPRDLTPESITPSSLRDAEPGSAPSPDVGPPSSDSAGREVADAPGRAARSLPPAGVEHSSIGDGLTAKLGLSADQRGDLLHRCFEALSGHPERGALLYDIANARRLGDTLTPEQRDGIAANVAQFDAWLADRFAPVSVGLEVPILALDDRGSVVWGYVDVIVETADGLWIVDHKSDHTDDRRAKFAEHLPQLTAYADAVAAARPDAPVLGVAIHWITYGEATLLEL